MIKIETEQLTDKDGEPFVRFRVEGYFIPKVGSPVLIDDAVITLDVHQTWVDATYPPRKALFHEEQGTEPARIAYYVSGGVFGEITRRVENCMPNSVDWSCDAASRLEADMEARNADLVEAFQAQEN